MNTDAVIGCDAVDAGDAWLRLKTSSGGARTIPWTSIKLAGLGGNHQGSITIGGVTEKTTPYRHARFSVGRLCRRRPRPNHAGKIES